MRCARYAELRPEVKIGRLPVGADTMVSRAGTLVRGTRSRSLPERVTQVDVHVAVVTVRRAHRGIRRIGLARSL
jgi:hypothetical protein